jgi:hypothetical protein
MLECHSSRTLTPSRTEQQQQRNKSKIESEHEKLVHPTLTHTHTPEPELRENSHEKKGEEKKYRPSAKCTFRCVKNRQTAAQLATTIEKHFKVTFITRAAYTIAGHRGTRGGGDGRERKMETLQCKKKYREAPNAVWPAR